MRAVIRFVCRYPIAFRKLPMDLSTKVRKCGAKIFVEPSHTLFVWTGVRLGRVIDEVIREILLRKHQSFLSPELLRYSAGQLLSLFQIPPCYSFPAPDIRASRAFQ